MRLIEHHRHRTAHPMTAILVFSAIATALVYLAGRKDHARDPQLTRTVLVLLAVFPLLWWMLPKIAVLPTHHFSTTNPTTPWLTIGISLWSIGVAVATLRLACAASTLARWRQQSVLLEKVDHIEIRELTTLTSPVASGIFHPIIFVPPAWHHWPTATRQLVLAHEITHHRHRDPLWRWLAGITLAVHWFNPLVWWLTRRLAIQAEFACDAGVLRGGGNPHHYAMLLCDLAQHPTTHGPHALAMAQPSSLECRVRRLSHATPHTDPSHASIMLALAITAAVLTAIVGSQTTPLSRQEIETRWSANPFPAEF